MSGRRQRQRRRVSRRSWIAVLGPPPLVDRLRVSPLAIHSVVGGGHHMGAFRLGLNETLSLLVGLLPLLSHPCCRSSWARGGNGTVQDAGATISRAADCPWGLRYSLYRSTKAKKNLCEALDQVRCGRGCPCFTLLSAYVRMPSPLSISLCYAEPMRMNTENTQGNTPYAN